MVDCDYCDASFEGEDAYLDHLEAAHEGELGSIDQRRVDGHSGGSDGDGSLPVGPTVLVGVIGFSLAIVVYVVVFMGGGGGGGGGGAGAATVNGFEVQQTPGDLRSAHGHGTINVTIDGQQIDFSQDRYQLEANKFHFERGNGRIWHTHASGVTVEYAMATLGIGVTENSVTFEGTTYRDGENAEVVVQVNGQSVDPSTYVLQGTSVSAANEGDHVRIVVRPTN